MHAGDVGTGFNGAELDRLWKMLEPLETDDVAVSRASRRRWAARIGRGRSSIAQVRYTEVTDDGRLRHPVYLGLRDDKKPRAT